MARAELTEDGEFIAVKTSWAEGDLIRQMPGFNWKPQLIFPGTDEKGYWRGQVSWAGCLQLRGIFREQLVIGSRLGEWARRERISRVDVADALRGLTEISEMFQTPEAEVVRSWR